MSYQPARAMTAPGRIAAVALAALLAGCQTATDARSGAAAVQEATPAAESVVPPLIDWSHAGDCLDQLRLLSEAADAGRLAPGQQVPVAVAVRAAGALDDWTMPPARPLRVDLPLPVHDAEGVAVLAVPCVLEIGPARDLQAEHRPVGRETVRSMYVTGTRSERNPEYDQVQARVRQAERDLKSDGIDVMTVGDPMLDLVGLLMGGVLGAFEARNDHAELDEALSELASTPRTHEHPVLRPYHFERTVVRARRSAVVPVSLTDRRRGRTWRTELRQRELREFHILEGLDPRDSDYAGHREQSITRLELDRWHETAPEVPISGAIAALLEEPAGAPPAAASLALASPGRIAPAAGPAAPPAAQEVPLTLDDGAGAQGVVAIAVGRQAGSGFYVHPHFVLTALPLLAGRRLVDVTTADGETVPGLLALADAERGLALVHVPRPGLPLTLSAATPAITGTPAGSGLQGAPLLAGGRVAGMVSALADPLGRDAAAVSSTAIFDFLEEAAGSIPALREVAPPPA